MYAILWTCGKFQAVSSMLVLAILESTEAKYDLKKTIVRVTLKDGPITRFVINPQRSLLKMRCPFDVKFFPIDQQFCTISISDGSLRHSRASENELNFKLYGKNKRVRFLTCRKRALFCKIRILLSRRRKTKNEKCMKNIVS